MGQPPKKLATYQDVLDAPTNMVAELVLVPDLAGWKRERLPALPRAPYVEFAPDWICEALSPSTERFDRTKKMAIYAREKVAHAWLLNAEQRLLEVYRRSGSSWLRVEAFEGDVQVRAEPFEAIEVDLSALWADVVATSTQSLMNCPAARG